VNWVAEYKLIYLKQQKLVTRAARPSLLNTSAHNSRMSNLLKAVPYDFWNAGYVEDPASERRCHGSFSLRQRDADVCGFQSPTVVSAITAEATTVVYTLQLLNQLMLLIG